MTNNRPMEHRNDLVALLAKIDQEIVEAESLLDTPLTEPELAAVRRELDDLRQAKQRAERMLEAE